MSESSRGTAGEAISRIQEMISAREFDLAIEQADEVLRVAPGDPRTRFLKATALRRKGELVPARDLLQEVASVADDVAGVHQELGYAYYGLGNASRAMIELKRAIELQDQLPEAWRLLGQLLAVDEQEEEANEAWRKYLALTNRHPAVVEAVRLVGEGKLGMAEGICKEYLKRFPNDVTVIRLLAEIGLQLDVHEDARNLLERCLELAPDFHLARNNYANALGKLQQYEQALAQIDYLEKVEPNNLAHSILAASILVRTGDYDQAIDRYEGILARVPDHALLQMSYGHALKTVGRQADAITAYRRAISEIPSLGEAWWSLANLKTFRFEPEDIETMREAVDAGTGEPRDYFHLCFALGKALEDRGDYDDSFTYYDKGNAFKRTHSNYDADDNERRVTRLVQTCSAELFTKHAGTGCPAADPIFIVGLPRSGSTLLEQILASHSQVDGTMELPNIPMAARRLGDRRGIDDSEPEYPAVLHGLDAQQLRELGEEYIEKTRIQRQGAPHFIDKMPNNFMHVGLIKLILPNAKIIDARRYPLATCFSAFKQLFAAGQEFTYGLENVGRYYRDYVRLMDHWNEVLPGEVLLMQYEDVIDDFEPQVRRMLEFCELEFEPQCLEFHKTSRPVRTASSEQVRQPLYRDAVEQWRNFEAHLDPLKTVLGPVLQRYRD